MKAMATHQLRGSPIKYIGSGEFSSVTEAQSVALAYGADLTGSYRDLHWKQFSPTTWGLMNGIAYTGILVGVIGPQPAHLSNEPKD